MKPSEILSEVARRFETGEWGWHQHSSARDKEGIPVMLRQPSACSFCLLGALSRTTAPSDRQGYGKAVEYISKAIPDYDHEGLVAWNDAPGRTKEQVTGVLKDAAKLAIEAGEWS